MAGASPAMSSSLFRAAVSVQSELAVDRLELRRLNQPAVSHAHRMQWPFKLFLPEREKTLQLGKVGEQIVILPDVGLQQPAIIGTPIQDVRRRQAITTDLFTEILRNHFVPSRVGLKVSVSGAIHCKPKR